MNLFDKLNVDDNKPLDYAAHPDHDPYPGILKRNFYIIAG